MMHVTSKAKAFSKMKGLNGDEKTWPDWRYKFRVEASRCFHHAAAILDGAENRYDQSISEADIQQVKLPRASDPKHKGKGKGVKGKKGASSLDEWPGGQSNQTPSEKYKEYAEVAGIFIGAVNRRAKCSRGDWLTWNRIQEQAQRQWKSYKSGNLGANAVDVEMGEGIDLTIDSFCAACTLPVGVASAIGMQKWNRTHQEHIAANAEKSRELAFKIPTLKTSEWRRAEFEIQCHGQATQTFGSGVQSCRCRKPNRAATREPRWSLH